MSTAYLRMVRGTAVPWRIRNALDQWVERHCRVLMPGLYRWLHFGSSQDLLQPVTRGPKHHFFGYYDKSPWNASQSLLLAHAADFNDRPPTAADRVQVGVVHLADGRFEPLGESSAWNWQQGCMLAWHPADPERLFVHNDRRQGQFVGIVRNTSGTEVRAYERPIYALSPDGKSAWSLYFARLATHRPGYGYEGVADSWATVAHPADDGVWLMDLQSGSSRLIVTLDQLATRKPLPSMAGQFHWINHIQPSPGGSRIAFFHLWRVGQKDWAVRLYVCSGDGGDLSCALDTGRISHYDWLDEDHVLVWARRQEGGERFLLVDVRTVATRRSARCADGGRHDSFSPDRRWVLNDTYPDGYDMRTLMSSVGPTADAGPGTRLLAKGEVVVRFAATFIRVEPRRQTGCVDSVHDGSRQIYVVDVSRWTA